MLNHGIMMGYTHDTGFQRWYYLSAENFNL